MVGAQPERGPCPSLTGPPAGEGPQRKACAEPRNLYDRWPVLESPKGSSGHQPSSPRLHSLDSETSPSDDGEASVDKSFASNRQNTHLVTVSEKMSLS